MEKCKMCGHDWHGLVCQHQTTRLDENHRFSTYEMCKCPGPFGQNGVNQ